MLDNIKNKKIFVSALDWGLGHCTRTAAIIQQLKPYNEIIIFVSSNQIKFFSQLFADIKIENISSYNINFHPDKFLDNFTLIKIFQAIHQEQQVLKKFVQQNFIPDIIISDQRYGFYHPSTYNIFITHQINLQIPFYLKFINNIHHILLKKFNEIWIPDYENTNSSLAGKLSHSQNKYLNQKIKYIHPQSLMKKKSKEKIIDYLFIISGTGTEKNYYEKYFTEIAHQLLDKNTSLIIKIIGGNKCDNNIYLGWKNFIEVNDLISPTKNVVTRPGYSTLMDWHLIKDETQKLFLVEPKFQFEQKYLYSYWISKNWAYPIDNLFK